ncbi:putative nucleotidyltransferase, ribonuclease H [Tanacetum coccineum]
MGYSAIASPLTDLLKKNKAWIWDEECQVAFESLKKAVMKEPVLRLPDVTMPFELHTDASDFAIGGVLMQDGHPIAFESQKLNETERKYTVQEKEMTAVVYCLRIWRHYLLGSRFVIKTDNIATSYFQTQKKLSPKQARWQDFLAEFDYQLEYKPGKANVVADALSRKAEFTAITQAQFFLQDRIKEGLEHDPFGQRSSLAFGKNRGAILKRCHGSKRAGHPWITRTLALVEGTYYWPRMGDDVETFVRMCLICQQNKIEQNKSGGLLEPLPMPKGPWESVSMDFITCLPKSEGGGSIIVVMDRFLKSEIHEALLDGVVQDHGDEFELLHEFSSLNGRENGEGECAIRALSSALYLARATLEHGGPKEDEEVWSEMKKRRHVEFEVSYQVQLLPKLKIHPVFHVSFLKRYHGDEEDPERGVFKRAPTAVVTSYDREVEEILSDRTIRRRGVPGYKEYLIKWRDLPDSEASWEAKDLLWQFANEIKRYHEDGTTRKSRA